MANIILGDKREEVKDGSEIKEACKELGVPFSCEQGVCGTCKITVEEGADNLSELSDAEEDLDMDESHRLACQCKIKSGVVVIKLEEKDKEEELDTDMISDEDDD